jgi:hypothetical protein
MTAADLIDDLKFALHNALDDNDSTNTEAEMLRAIDVVVEAVRAEAFQPSPITAWLMGSPGHRFTLAEYDEEKKLIRCNLDDVDDDTDEPVATGFGESIEEAQAAAVNAAMSKEN